LTTSFIKITQAIDKAWNQDEYNIDVSMLDEEELECLKHAQRLRIYANRQWPAAPAGAPTIDTNEGKSELKKRGRKNNPVQDQVIDVDVEPTSPDETPPSLLIFLILRYCSAI